MAVLVDRAMTPSGAIYFPSPDYYDDFSSAVVPVRLRALFMHEATHLYQWYVLGQWVIVRGPFDRNYQYELKPGKPLKDYGLEQMGQIVEDFYNLQHGARGKGFRFNISDYRNAVPVKAK